MRQDVTPPVKLESLTIDGADNFDAPRARFKRVKEADKRLVAVVVFLIALVLIAGGLGLYVFLLHANPFSETPAQTASHQTTSGALSAKTLVAKAKASAQGRVIETLNDTNGKPYSTFSAPPFRPTGYNFSVRPDADYGFSSYGTKNIIATDLTALQKILKDAGLKATVLDPGSETGQYAAAYESDTIICSVSDQKPAKPSSTSTDYSTAIGCADTSAYLTNAATLRPYFIVYASQSRTDTSHVLISGPTLKASKSAGYSTATVSISSSVYGSAGGFAGLYYVTPDNILRYFTGTQSILSCSMYATTDLKKAYLGEQCYDDATGNDETTVKI